MSQEPTETEPLPLPRPRTPRERRFPWPLAVGLAFVIPLLVGTAWVFFSSTRHNEPWRIDYPGVEWTRGQDAYTPEGKHYLQAEVRFDQDSVSAYELETFMAELVRQTNKVYDYYHIRALNRKNVHVLDAVADRAGAYGISVTRQYEDQ